MIRYKPIPLPTAMDFNHGNFKQSLCGNKNVNVGNNMANNNVVANNNMRNNNMVNNM